ncbi:MAG TPA: gamma-glutamylcyclotransferase family protein [Terracidiphilus sp.]|nr:gamma-glutamylcyclotransferase family protein [Terracidiphilus sp.]
MEGATTIFVYGTLKRGCRNHHVLQSATFLGEARTEPLYLMVNCGSYPGLVHANGVREGQAICGELYRMDSALLAALDAFEDAPHEFVRASIALQNGSNAEGYFYSGEAAHLPLCGAVWLEE